MAVVHLAGVAHVAFVEIYYVAFVEVFYVAVEIYYVVL